MLVCIKTPDLIVVRSSRARSVIILKNSPPLRRWSPIVTPEFHMQHTTRMLPISIFYNTAKSFSPAPSSPSSSNPSAKTSFC
jgi:hypothetical protein